MPQGPQVRPGEVGGDPRRPPHPASLRFSLAIQGTARIAPSTDPSPCFPAPLRRIKGGKGDALRPDQTLGRARSVLSTQAGRGAPGGLSLPSPPRPRPPRAWSFPRGTPREPVPPLRCCPPADQGRELYPEGAPRSEPRAAGQDSAARKSLLRGRGRPRVACLPGLTTQPPTRPTPPHPAGRPTGGALMLLRQKERGARLPSQALGGPLAPPAAASHWPGGLAGAQRWPRLAKTRLLCPPRSSLPLLPPPSLPPPPPPPPAIVI